MKSTNYKNTLIEVAEDCKFTDACIPPYRGEKKTIANIEYEILIANPYRYTSDDVKFIVHAKRNSIPASKKKAEREAYFSKGQPCFRASPLTKTYGWGVHSDEDGRVAIFGVESAQYSALQKQLDVASVKAMRSRKK